MRTLFTRFFAIICGILLMNNVQAGGGPDAYGYVWLDSNDPGGPAFSWVDILTKPGVVQVSGLADDNSVGPYNLGFDFHYYWSDYNQVKLGSNGWIGFNNIGNIASCFPNLPTAAGSGDNFIAPFMSDVNFSSSYPNFPNVGEMWFWTNSADTAIITYKNVAWWKNTQNGSNPPDWQGDNTFQVILTSTDSSITYNYLDTDAPNLYVSGGCQNSFVVGIENITGNIGLEALNNTVPGDSTTIKFYYPAVVTFTVPDVSPAWNANTENKGQFFLVGANIDMETAIENVGNVDVTSTINISGNLTKLDLVTQVWNDNTSLPSLNQGATQMVTFPTQASIPSAGQYYYNVTVTNGSDINPSNNNNSTEVSAIEATGGVYPLTYCTGNPPDGGVSWAGGNPNDGIAVFYRPPVSPAQLNSVDIFIVEDADPQTPITQDCSIEIWSEDSNGNPDTLIESVTVPANDIQESAWTTVPVPGMPTFSSGDGFFVFWKQGTGGTIAIGTEGIGPISRRTLEILGGAPAEYRENSTRDVLMRANIDAAVALEEGNNPVNEFRLFPNPASGLLNLSFQVSGQTDAKIRILNVAGQQVFAQNFLAPGRGEHQISLDIAKLDQGIYFVEIEANGTKMTEKLAIQR